MEIKINVDETMFKDVLENELKAFSKEELHEIVRECIIEALRNDGVLKNLFVNESKDYWGTYTYKPTEVVFEAARSIDLSPAYTEIKDKMITTLKEDYHGVLERAMSGLIIDGIANDYEFRNRMERVVSEILCRRNNN